MRRPTGRICALAGALLLSLGCGQPVREDRTIQFSAGGKQVGFQQGAEGVFVADQEGGGLKKIFSPDATTLAVSSPLFNPRGKQLLFTSAHRQGNQPAVRLPGTENTNPAGNIHHQQEVAYTCWLREGNDEPKALLQARCDHPGYIAANLAVRWHPRGDRILFLDQPGKQQHGLFELELATGKKRRVFPHLTAALLFDWSPDNQHLACVVSSPNNDQSTDGIWIGQLEAETWWHVPESEHLAHGSLDSLIERLRASRPAWTRDGARFAFVTCTLPAVNVPPTYHVRTGRIATNEVALLTQGPQRFRDLGWSPDGRLGLVQEGQPATLHVVGPKGELTRVPTQGPVRCFAGWDASGKHLAYVTPDAQRQPNPKALSLLFLPDPHARESVVLADAAGPERTAFAGMRVTFPQWSPTEKKLSVWFTFTPPQRCWLLRMLGLGLRPGDPAAILRPESGEVNWMAVNGLEKAQIGHYFLLQRQYADAWKWYVEAEKELPRPQPAADVLHLWQQWLSPSNISLFEYHCLQKLGRAPEAAAKLEQFRKRLHEQPAGAKAAANLPQPWADALAPDSPQGILLRDLYAVEVFASVDALADGQVFFREQLSQAGTDPERLSSAVALAQLHALAGETEPLAELVTQTLLPTALRVWKPRSGSNALDWNDPQTILLLAVGATLIPLAVPDHLAEIPEKRMDDLVQRWQALRPQARDDASNLALDLLLNAGYQRLGRVEDRRMVSDRLQKNPARAELLGEKTPAELVRATRESVEGVLQFLGAFASSD